LEYRPHIDGGEYILANINKIIEIIMSDITKIKVDAIVNAANSSLLGGGGVDGAIHRAGGKGILEECKKIVAKQGECKTGNAVITTAGNLPAKYVIHTVGPIWNENLSKEKKLLLEKKLSDCYLNSLKLSVENGCKTIAFPNISTGVYRFPKDLAAKISIQTIKEFLEHNKSIEKVILVCFDDENFSFCNNFIPKRKK
jgi:O-acetyl-ADP-ribose deacetylase